MTIHSFRRPDYPLPDDGKRYRPHQFARLAGVTVRTLHFYDQAGLLKPSGRTESDHRLYAQHDLLRLQQILTLKSMGFSLKEISALLNSPAYDLIASLRLQKQAVEGRIRQMQMTAYTLGRTLEALEASGEIIWSEVIAILHSLNDTEQHDWIRQKYYTDEQWAWLMERSAHFTPEQAERSAQAWAELTADFGRVRHLPPDHPEVLPLGARMDHLIRLFTGGDATLEASMAASYRDPEGLPEAFRLVDTELHTFMNRAMLAYRAANAHASDGDAGDKETTGNAEGEIA